MEHPTNLTLLAMFLSTHLTSRARTQALIDRLIQPFYGYLKIFSPILAIYGLFVKPHTTSHLWQDSGMRNKDLDKIIARNIKFLMERDPNLNSQPKLAGKSGVGQTTIGRILRGEVSTTTDSLAGIADAFSISAQQLMSADLIQSIEQPGAIDHSKASFPQLIKWEDLSEWCKDPDYDSRETIYCHFPSGPNAIVVVVSGQAMAYKYEPGEYVCFDPDVVAKNEDDVLVRTGGGKILFRRLQRTPEGDHLLALNSKWPNDLIEMPKNSTICAVVIGSWEDKEIA